VVERRRPRGSAPDRRARRRAAALCAISSATLTRSNGARGRPAIVIPRQLGHSNLGITSIYPQGIDNAEIIDTVPSRRAPMVPVSA
jgi:hypothetical protein